MSRVRSPALPQPLRGRVAVPPKSDSAKRRCERPGQRAASSVGRREGVRGERLGLGCGRFRSRQKPPVFEQGVEFGAFAPGANSAVRCGHGRGLGLRPRRGRRGSWECRATPHTESSGVRKKRVARLMRELELRGADGRRAGPRTTVRDPKRPSARDLVDRDFARAEPNRLWSAISSTSRPGRASSSSPPSRTSTAAGSSAGRCATTSRPSSSWTRSGWRSAPAAATAPAWLHTPITVRSTRASSTAATSSSRRRLAHQLLEELEQLPLLLG